MAETPLTPTKYYDGDLTTGLDDGTSWANAYQTFQKACDNVVAGDVVACQGSETVSTEINFNTTGSAVGNTTVFQAGYSGGVWDGTSMVTLTGSSVATVFSISDVEYGPMMILFKFQTATGNLVNLATTNQTIFDRCFFDDAATGIDCNAEFVIMYGCYFGDSITGDAIVKPGQTSIIRDSFINGVGGNGISEVSRYTIIDNNLIVDVGALGIDIASASMTIIQNNTIHNSGSSAIFGNNSFAGSCVIRFNRLTSSGGYGIQFTDNGAIIGDWNLFHNNTSGETSIVGTYVPAGSDISASGDGYTNSATGDYTLTSTAEGRRIGYEVGMSSTNISYKQCGALIPDDSGGGVQLGVYQNGIWR